MPNEYREVSEGVAEECVRANFPGVEIEHVDGVEKGPRRYDFKVRHGPNLAMLEVTTATNQLSMSQDNALRRPAKAASRSPSGRVRTYAGTSGNHILETHSLNEFSILACVDE